VSYFDPVVADDAIEFEGSAPPEDFEPHSWTPVDLIATVNLPPEPPSISGLAYPGRRHVYSGEPETLKSWLVLILSVDEIHARHNVLYIDFNEMGGRDVLERLRALGLSDEQISERFIYIEPHEAMTDPGVLADVTALIDARDPSLVVLDAFTGALETHKLDPASGVDVQRFYRTVIDPLRAKGAALIVLDHLKKDPTNRGKFSIGSERKIGAADVHLGFEVIHPFGRGKTGSAKITVHKDRPGYLRRPKCAEFELVSDSAGTITWTLTITNVEVNDERPFRPTFLMERVSRHLETHGEQPSRRSVQSVVKGNAKTLQLAIDLLVSEGYAEEGTGARNARPVRSVKPYREAEDS
jgi:hypothetical protein